MTAEQDQSTDRSERERQLHKLAHDIRTPLGIVCTGLEALNVVREDADDFKEIYESIQQDGVGPLKDAIARLIEVACRKNPIENERD